MAIILTVIGSYIVVCGMSFLWNLLLAPVAMDREAADRETQFRKEIENAKATSQPENPYDRIIGTLESWELALLRELCKPDTMFNEPGVPRWLADRGYPISEHPLADINKKTGWLEQVQADRLRGTYRLSHRHLTGVKKALGM